MISAIFEGLMSFVLKIFIFILEVVMQYVIAPAIQIVLQLTVYTLSTFFYSLSCFCLGLIDFVEILFRLLAGLPGKPGTMGENVTLTLGDSKPITSGNLQSNDLLLQVILNKSVADVFLSMCIVGMFLLVITTIFKIIQVEYTTEGSKNAKGPILTKAFKGLCNMVLLPVLVLFGVFLGNQVLDLLDKATTMEGDGATIANVLFVAGVSDAFYTQNRQPMLISSTDIVNTTATEIIRNLVPIVVNIFSSIDWDGDGEESNSLSEDKNMVWDESAKDEILGCFTTASTSKYRETTKAYTGNVWEGIIDTPEDRIAAHLRCFNGGYDNLKHSYSNPVAVSAYFNLASINYIVILVGGVFVLKSLFFACFGLIQRLYQCAMLFIISPAVIGMTPVNDGNLGKWRGKFIGQVLCAYGVVVAINLFLILVKIFLNINLTFTNVDFIFSSAFMESLLKAVFVIAGALMIEKFSKEIGSYFGADDAVSAGSDVAKGVMNVASKGAMVAAGGVGMVAKGATMAVKGGKAVANRISAIKQGGAADRAAGNIGIAGMARGAFGLKQKEKVEGADKAEASIKESRDFLEKSYDEDKRMNALEEKSKSGKLTKKESREYKSLQDSSKERKEKQANARQSIRRNERLLERQAEVDKYNDKYGKHDGVKGLVKDTSSKAAVPLANHATNFKAFLGGAASNLSSMLLPKDLQNMGKFYQDMSKKGGDGSDEFEKAQVAIKEAKKDRRKGFVESGATGVLQERKNIEQTTKLKSLIIQNAKFQETQLKVAANSTLSKMSEAQKEIKKGKDVELNQRRLFSYEQSLASQGINKNEHYHIDVDGNFKLNEGVKLGPSIDEFITAINKATNNGKKPLSEGTVKDIIEEAVKNNSDSQAREFEKLLQKTMSQINNAKG